MSRLVAHATSPNTAGAGLVLVPVGSTEQHGPHLPLDTDTVIAEAVARAVAQRVPDAWVAPAIAYGASGEHHGFPGTSSIGTEALRHVLVELVRSLRVWARRVVFVNGHGGNVTALAGAVDQLVTEGHDVSWVPCAVPDGDAHAGRTETSLMLHLRSASVRTDLAEPGNTAPLTALMPHLVQDGVRAVSVNGVLGDPTGANADEGRRFLAVMVDHVLDRLSSHVPG
jgi:creatinine amidohydrolase